MRQKNVTLVAVLAVGFAIAIIAVFAIVRQGQMAHNEGNTEHHHNEHEHEHTEARADMVKGNPEHEGSDRDQASESSGTQPSGVLKDGQRIVKIKARQFEFEPDRIVVKKGEKVRLEVTSEDVTHGMGIEAFNIDRKLEPGTAEIITFNADKVGEFHFHCSVYCGRGHSDMHGELIIVE